MRVRSVVALVVVLLLGSVAFAQDYPKAEVGLKYAYTRFNPAVSGLGSFSLNGGGGDVTYFFTNNLGIKAEFVGSTSQTRTVQVCQPGCINLSIQGNLFTYNALLVYKARMSKFEPYIEGGMGGAHSNAYANVFAACNGLGIGCGFTKKPSNNAFDYVFGGGIDIPVSKTIAINVGQFDYIGTRFDSAITNGNRTQNSFRYQAGIIFRF